MAPNDNGRGWGPYSEVEQLRTSIRNDKQHLESGYQFTPRARKKLEDAIANQKANLKIALKKLKTHKEKVKREKLATCFGHKPKEKTFGL